MLSPSFEEVGKRGENRMAAQMEECKKDKATRAKEVAENMFTARDIFGAMRFALKAQRLFPCLEGITQMITTFGVYIAAMNTIDGEADWYGILGVGPLADDDTVRNKYRNLAFTLHPDKNKSIGADGAFKLVAQAWSLLSDKAKRVAYDEKINAIVCKLATECEDLPAQTGSNCDYSVTRPATSSAKIQNKTAHIPKSNKFWTVCHRCNTKFQYFRAYVNRRLVCRICYEVFLAVEIDRPVRGVYRCFAARRFFKNRQTINQQVLDKSNFHCSPLSRTTSGVSSPAQDANVVQQAHEKVKRKREEAQATQREEALQGEDHVAKKGYFNPAKIRSALEDISLSSHGEARVNQPGAGNGGVVGASNTCKSKQGDFCGISEVTETSIAKGAYRVELQNHLMEMAIKEISMKLEELKPGTDDSQKVNEIAENYLRSSDTCDQDKIGKSEARMSGFQATKPFAGTSTMADMVTETLGKMSIDVPDTIVKGSAYDGMEEASVEDLINDMGKLGKEKEGSEKLSRE